jgi:Holliday junction resolvase RusA-like endonuclease
VTSEPEPSSAEPDVEIVFPVEFSVRAVPISQQASAASRTAWKDQVSAAARERLQEGFWATTKVVSVTIYYFVAAEMVGDVDNIVKPILDALCKLIYLDDHQVERVLVQKFEPDRVFSFTNPTPKLAEALEQEPPVVYIRIDDDRSRESPT